jgi:hypothetical protein
MAVFLGGEQRLKVSEETLWKSMGPRRNNGGMGTYALSRSSHNILSH